MRAVGAVDVERLLDGVFHLEPRVLTVHPRQETTQTPTCALVGDFLLLVHVNSFEPRARQFPAGIGHSARVVGLRSLLGGALLGLGLRVLLGGEELVHHLEDATAESASSLLQLAGLLLGLVDAGDAVLHVRLASASAHEVLIGIAGDAAGVVAFDGADDVAATVILRELLGRHCKSLAQIVKVEAKVGFEPT